MVAAGTIRAAARFGSRATATRAVATALFAIALLALVFLTPGSARAQTQAPAFPDVDATMPAYEAIGYLSAAGIISGYVDGSFGPGDTLKRGQATKMLVLWQNVPVVTGQCSFPDVDAVYRNYIETAFSQGWITGFSNGRFKPYYTLSRQQMAIIMVRAMGWEETALELSHEQVTEALAGFVDQEKISDVARPYVAIAASEGLFSGDGEGRLRPQDGITRAQFCLVVYRAEQTTGSWVQEIRCSSEHDNKTRLVIDLAHAASKITASASSDGVLTVDFSGGVVWQPISEAIEGSPEITNIAISQLAFDTRTARATLALGRYQTLRVMSLEPSDGKGHRIVIDVYRRLQGPEDPGPPLICIDPGHGGKDTGAVGVSGAAEKDVNLAMSLLLAENLREAGLRVMMTREDDTYPDLHQRATMANDAQANLFVSIHNNASGDPASKGTETFYWGTKESCSPDAQLLAQIIQRNLIAALGSFDRGAKTHWYELVVLAETEMTAALVEVGFMSNAAEEALLLTAEYQALAAQAVANGILEYLGWSTQVYSTES
ncbi:MAG: N-acetylmuramoyl-L-alanine amidase [Thermoleophilia bacterium]|nr:N-acetylmuramoyl-L-alanine amidase [Thermoleophilia bacterium]